LSALISSERKVKGFFPGTDLASMQDIFSGLAYTTSNRCPYSYYKTYMFKSVGISEDYFGGNIEFLAEAWKSQDIGLTPPERIYIQNIIPKLTGIPLAFYNRKCNTERDLLSCVLEQQIMIHTDHKNLIKNHFNSERFMIWRLFKEEY
jgi:hypothetical protein